MPSKFNSEDKESFHHLPGEDAEFIVRYITAVDGLLVLFLLMQSEQKPTLMSLTSELRTSMPHLKSLLERHIANHLVALDGDGYILDPSYPHLFERLISLENTYKKFKNSVIELIYNKHTYAMHKFSTAFMIKKGKV